MRYKYILLLLLVASLAVLTRSQSVLGCVGIAGPGAQAPRQAAPDFTVNAYADDSKVSLSDLRGKVVLLYFWFPT